MSRSRRLPLDTSSSEKCTARAKSTGNRCRRDPIAGATVCVVHGGQAPQVKRKAAERLALAEALAKGDRRPSWEVLADAAHSLDVVARHLRDQIVAGRRVDARTVDAFIEATERQSRLAKTVLDAGIDERRAQVMERVNRQASDAIVAVLTSVLAEFGLSVHDDQVRAAVARAMDAHQPKQIEGSAR